MRTPAHIWHARRATPSAPRAQGAEGVRLGAAQTIAARPCKSPRSTPERPPLLVPQSPSKLPKPRSISTQRRIRPGILILRPSARVLVSQRASVHHTAWTPVVLASDACQPAYTAMLPASGSGHDRAAHTTPSAQDMPVHCKSISSLAYLIVPGQQYQRVATTAAPPSACSQQHTPRQQQQQLCHPLRDKTIGKRRPNWSINNGVCLAISPVTFA